MGTAMAYLGDGKLVFYEDGILGAGETSRWFSVNSELLTNLRRYDVFYRVFGHCATERLQVHGRFLMYR